LTLTCGNFLNPFLGDQLAQGDVAQEVVDLFAQVCPQVMGQAAFIVLAIAQTTTSGTINFFIHGGNDFSDRDLVRGAAQRVAATRAARALDQTTASKTGNSCSR